MSTIVLTDPAAAVDLATFAARAARHEPDAVIRVVATGGAAAFYVDTAFDVLAVKTAAAHVVGGTPGTHSETPSLDLVVEAVGLQARAQSATTSLRGARLDLPPAVAALTWTASLPPRRGWVRTGGLSASVLNGVVDSGIEEFRSRVAAHADESLSQGAVRAAMESIAADIWGRDLGGDTPASLAHAAQSFGFLSDDVTAPDVVLRSCAAWRMLDATVGTVLARRADPLGLFAM